MFLLHGLIIALGDGILSMHHKSYFLSYFFKLSFFPLMLIFCDFLFYFIIIIIIIILWMDFVIKKILDQEIKFLIQKRK